MFLRLSGRAREGKGGTFIFQMEISKSKRNFEEWSKIEKRKVSKEWREYNLERNSETYKS